MKNIKNKEPHHRIVIIESSARPEKLKFCSKKLLQQLGQIPRLGYH